MVNVSTFLLTVIEEMTKIFLSHMGQSKRGEINDEKDTRKNG